jgi:hypothetical protein
LEEVAETEDNNALARSHIADGVRAMRAGSPEQAQREFEQALDLTDDPVIVRSAQKQLRQLSRARDKAARLPVTLKTPPPQPVVPVEGDGWIPAAQLGLIIALVNSLLTGCGALLCVGLVFTPFFGFIAGWWVARQAKENERTANTGHALLAGTLVSLGGWLGQVVGNFLWFSSSEELTNSELIFLACCVGSVYIATTLASSALGYKLKTSRKS